VPAPRSLSGGEIRFLRSALNMSGQQFASALAVTPVSVSRWENSLLANEKNGFQDVDAQTDRMIRLHVLTLLLAQPKQHMKKIIERKLGAAPRPKDWIPSFEAEYIDDHWEVSVFFPDEDAEDLSKAA
jgi:transcriptional regulator with XRE-family HTH domain